MVVFGKLIAATVGASAVCLTALSAPFLNPAFRRFCLPYVPATDQQLTNLLQALKRSNSSGPVIDLGSGDGRIVISAACAGYRSTGVEVNSLLVLLSKCKAWREGLSTGSANFRWKNMWKVNLEDYGTVIIFGTETLMPTLQQKLTAELKENSHVLACRFPLEQTSVWRLILTVGTGFDTVWVYVKTCDSYKNR